MAVVLVVDDIAALAEQYAYDLERIGGLQTRIASGGAEAMAAVAAEEIDCIILDLEMPGVDGFEVLRRLNKQGSTIPVIVYTGTGSYDRCIQAVRLGAHGFIDKEEPMERVALEVENAIERAQLEAEVATLRRDLGDDTPLIGSSGAMKKLKQDIARVAPVPSAVLVTGEASCSGTSAAPSPERNASAAAPSSAPATAPSFSTRSGNCPPPPRPSCYAFSRNAKSHASERRSPSRWTRAWWPPPTATSTTRSRRSVSAKTSTTASTYTSWAHRR
jgi:CheY-like chemotaxis protein